ncbi:MAG: HD domain-containing phosphohydrolase [Oscillospiraceae bacterium]
MLEILRITQYVGIAILLVELIYTFFQKQSKLQNYLLLLLISLLLNYVGYSMELKAGNVYEALSAVKVSYMGKPFILLFMFLLVVEYCRVKLPRWAAGAMLCFQFFITILVHSCEYQTLFYSDIGFTEEGLFPHIVFGHGVLYNIYIAVIMLYVAAIAVICVNALRKGGTKRRKLQISLFLVVVFINIAMLGVFLSGVTQGYDCTLLGYLAASVVFSLSIFRLNLFETVDLAKEQAISSMSDGIVVFSNENEVLYRNSRATVLLPDIRTNMVIRQDPKELLELKDGNFLFHEGRAYEFDEHIIQKNDTCYGHMFVLHDVTDSYNYLNRLEREVENKTEHIRTIQRKITLGMADMIESRDSNTGGHVKRTSDVIKIFVEKLKLCENEGRYSDEFYDNVINAAPMHDLGKIAVEDAVLRKPGAFTPEEYAEMKTHAAKGAQIVEQVLKGVEDETFLQTAINIAHYHHEKWDGSGYPDGLKGTQIPFEARIMALADVFDALVSKRCYKEKMSYEKAFRIIEDSLDSHFDNELGHHFLECREELIAYYENIAASENER